jgi:hypothetical protein
MRTVLTLLLAALAAAACSTKQVTPVAMGDEKRICIIENPKVRFDVLNTYREALEKRGFQVQVLAPSTSPSGCPVTTTYTGLWRLDFPLVYLAYAELRVYRDGRPTGRAVYNARASRNSAEGPINELVDDLFKR